VRTCRKRLYRIPGDPIIYPVALTATAKPDAAQYLPFLRSQTAKSIFEKYGFNFLVKPTS
jgi:molybdate transport system substrate-binding protein